MTSKELIDKFINYLKENNKSLSTTIAYQNDLEQLASSNISKSLKDFSKEDIKHGLEYLKEIKGLSPKTVSRKINSIRTFYRYLEIVGIIKENPSALISHPKFKAKKPRILSRAEYLAIREVSRANERLHLMIETLLQTGIRISELSRLEKKDLFLEGKKPYILIKAFSSNIERQVPLNYRLANLIKLYLLSNPNNHSNLFCTKSGKCIEIRNIRSSIDRAIMKAQIKNACVNDLRNTFIVHQLAQGISIARLAEIVGHKNSSTTIKYLALLEKKYKPSGTDSITEL